MKFELEDLDPRACDIEIKIGGEMQRFRLQKFSLLAQIWVRKEWGKAENWAAALDEHSEINKSTSGAANIEAICKTVHFLLEDKTLFPTWEDFAQAVGGGANEIARLGQALLVVIGLSQPVIDEIMGDAKKKMKVMAKGTKRKK